MCFSAEASFVAAGTLGTIGALTLTKVKSPKEIALATIPIFFAIQQLIEGFIWLSPEPGPALTYGFLSFAYVIWPIFVPLAFYLVEPKKKNKQRLKYLVYIGILVGIVLMIDLSIHRPVATIYHNSIHYGLVDSDPNPLTVAITIALYLTAVCANGLFSSFKYLRIFSLLTLISLIATLIFYFNSWQSVWCFFAAVLSITIYLHYSASSKS